MWDIPFKLLVSIVAGFFAGMFIDNLFGLQTPVFTIIFSILGLIAGIWSCIKKIM